jgi:polysaccharide export outer membrane protein
VFILRRGPGGGETPERLEVDLAAVLQTGIGPVTELRAGDTLIVPRAKLFYIYGQVNAPSSYVLRDDLTIIEAISLAGGLTELGSVRRIEVKRRDAEGRVRSFDVDVDDPVLPEDVINVKERLF